MDADERRRRVHAAYAHLEAAIEKLRAELEAQAHARCRLAEDREDARRAYESWQSVDREACRHVQLAREALGLAEREEAEPLVRVALEAEGSRWGDQPPEEVLEAARRRRTAQDLAFGMSDARPEDYDLPPGPPPRLRDL